MKNFYIRKYNDSDIVYTILFDKYIANNAKNEDIRDFCEELEAFFVDKAIASDILDLGILKSQMKELLQNKDIDASFRLRKKSQLLFNFLFHSLQQENFKL